MLSFFLSLQLSLTLLVSNCSKCDADPDICEEYVAGYKLFILFSLSLSVDHGLFGVAIAG